MSPPSRILPATLSDRGPNVIGATGGSGTRVVAKLVREGGLYTGRNLNAYEDALDLAAYSDRWINSYVDSDSGPESPLLGEMAQDLRRVLDQHLAGLPPTQTWGWKEPRSIYLLRFLHQVMPSLRFLHVVRDGRDMAFSENQKQLEKHGSVVLEGGPLSRLLPGRRAARSIDLWKRVNLAAADYGERELGEAYLRIRFEDLCSEPALTGRAIYDFFGLEGDVEALARREVRAPATLGRWRTKRGKTVRELERAGEPALARFGYL